MNRPHRRWLFAAAGLALLGMHAPALAQEGVPGPHAVGAIQDGDPRVETTLIVDAATVAPGGTFRAGVIFETDPGWHVYWSNPGQTGLATEVTWSATEAAVTPTEWPAPTVFEANDGFIVSYGYEGEVLLPATVTVSDTAAGVVALEATADYLVCASTCIPGRQTMMIGVPVGDTTSADAEAGARFDDESRKTALLPEQRQWSLEASLSPAAPAAGETFTMRLLVAPIGDAPAPAATATNPAQVFVPDRVPQLEWTPQRVATTETGVEVVAEGRIGLDPVDGPRTLSGILLLDPSGAPAPVRFSIPLPPAEAP